MSAVTLHTTNFPLYTVDVLDKDHFVVAGGGGSAKTGVPNALQIFKLKYSDKEMTAEKVHEHDSERKAIMNCSIHPKEKSLAVGKENECHLLSIDITKKTQSKTDKKKNDAKEGYKVSTLCSEVTVKSVDEIDDGDFQKVVRFTGDGEHIVTGGSNGYVCVLKYPTLKCLHNFKAHDTDVDDLAVHPNSKRFVTVSRDTKAYVWRLEEGKREFELFYTGPNGDDSEDAFRIRACRFLTSEKGEIFLYTIQVPAKFDRHKPSPSLIVKWDCSKWIPKLSRSAGLEPLTQMAVSDDGHYVGVGTASGSIAVYISWNLAPLVSIPEVHNIFVTGLAFLPPSQSLEDSNKEFGLLTISADNTCRLVTLPNRREFSIWWILIGSILLLYLTFLALGYLGFDL
ncbi:prolactin regulatory element-binding protein-like [Dendronephthya gigantea]|uniref:prolactin regulatory element-binding protein-like n=1 Tax=Dendronephthya gigantea TaxID=151771 RepID=UPI00106B3F37|nr:prolactin regulatory element-binding protein-like [Dendronephthya gigantea]